MQVNPEEFVSMMTPLMFHAAEIATQARITVLPKAHENVPGSENEVDRSSRVDVLSETDLAVQELLLTFIAEHWSFVRVLAEEDTPTKGRFAASTSPFSILIDPIDGTKNYIAGDSHYCHIVSLMRDREMLATLLYTHATGRLLVAVRGAGTRVISPTGVSTRVQFRLDPNGRVFFHHVSRIPPAVVKNLENADFRTVASSQNASDILTLLDSDAIGFVSYTPLIYDVWSPGMIVEEAGGWISDWAGQPLRFDGPSRLPHVLVASSCKVADKAIQCIAGQIPIT